MDQNQNQNSQPAADTTQPTFTQQPVAPAPVAQAHYTPRPAPLGLISLIIGVAALISLPLVSGFGSSEWLLVIPLIIGAAGLALAFWVAKKESLSALIVLAIALGAIVTATSFVQLTQTLILKGRTQSQLEGLNLPSATSPSTNGSTGTSLPEPVMPNGSTGGSSSNGSSSSGSSSTSDVNKQLEEARERIRQSLENSRSN